VLDQLLAYAGHPLFMFIAIILASYVLEDLAIVSVAILAADNIVSIPLAATAILAGIISGDIGLYLLGYLAQTHQGLRNHLFKKRNLERFRPIFKTNLVYNILIIRFVPGLRFLCYTSCGLFRAHFWHFVLGVTIATGLWVAVVFSLIYQLGSSTWLQYSHWKWALVPVALLLLYFSNRYFKGRLEKEYSL